MIRETIRRQTRTTVLTVTSSQVSGVRRSDIVQTGCRLYDGGRIGTAGALGDGDPAELESRARQALELGIPYPAAPSRERTESVQRTCDFTSDEAFIEEMESLLGSLRREHPGFTFFQQLHLHSLDVRLRNDVGLDLHFQDTCFVVGLLFKEKGSPHLFDGSLVHSHRQWDREGLLDHARELLGSFRQPVPLPSGTRHPVIFDDCEASRDHPLGYFAQALHGRVFGAGGSPLSGRLGQRVFGEQFTLLQSRHPDESTLPFFDAEGVVHDGYCYTLIQDGVLQSPLTDKRISHAYGYPLSGNAHAAYDEVPSLAPLPVRPRRSSATLRELLGGRPGILVAVSMGGDFTPDGHFAAPVQLAFLFDGERLLGRLPQLQISGSAEEMFGAGFIGASADPYPRISTDHLLALDLEVSALQE